VSPVEFARLKLLMRAASAFSFGDRYNPTARGKEVT
jgi:hypothetical protein